MSADKAREIEEGRGTLDLLIRDEDSPASPPAEAWPAMSGAAVFAKHSLVGIIRLAGDQSKRHQLKVLPIERLLTRIDVEDVLASYGLGPLQRLSDADSTTLSHLDRQKPAIPDRPWSVPKPAAEHVFVERALYRNLLAQKIDEEDINLLVLLGFAGQGKTELVKRWIAGKARQPSSSQFQGAFWFSLDRGLGFEAFIDAACDWLKILTSGSTTNERMRQLLIEVERQRFLIVLDNFERLLEINGAGQGAFREHLAFDFFESIKNLPKKSCFVVLSRMPPGELIQENDDCIIRVDGLNDKECRELLDNFGIHGEETLVQELLDSVERHPIRLVLAANFIKYKYRGRIEEAFDGGIIGESEITRSSPDVLSRYDEMLLHTDLDVACLIAQVRQDCTVAFLQEVLDHAARAGGDRRIDTMRENLLSSIAKLKSLYLVGLEDAKLNIHPMVKHHFAKKIELWSRDQVVTTHRAIASIFAKEGMVADRLSPERRSISKFRPWIEHIYHLCQAGERGRRKSFGEAFDAMRKNIDLGDEFVLTGQLAGWTTRADILAGFFTERNFSSGLAAGVGPATSSFILNEVGQCQTHSGAYEAAKGILREKIGRDVAAKRLGVAAVGCRNLSDVGLLTGDLRYATQWMLQSLNYAEEYKTTTGVSEHVMSAQFGLGLLYSMQGDCKYKHHFAEGMALRRRRIDDGASPAVLRRGVREVRYADHLYIQGKISDALSFVSEQVRILDEEERGPDLALALRVRGDCLRHMGQLYEADIERALLLAQKCDEPFIQIDCELASCRGDISRNLLRQAERTLSLARARAEKLEYRILIIHCDLLQCKIYKNRNELESASHSLERAKYGATMLGYAWFDAIRAIWNI